MKKATIAVAIGVLAAVAGGPAAPHAAETMPWMLALPPLKGAETEATDLREAVRSRLDRTAEVTEWRRGQVYASGEQCEDARLEAIRQFKLGADAIADRRPTAAERERLTAIGARAFGRCVPGFAFGEEPAREAREPGAGATTR